MEYSRPRKRRGPPTVSPVPPQRGLTVPVRGQVAPDRGRVVSVFGPPGAGCTTITRCLSRAAQGVACLVPGFEDLEEKVRAARAEVILVDGYPLGGLTKSNESIGPAAIQYLYDRRLIFPSTGALVRVEVDPDLLVHGGRATQGGVDLWFRALPALEDHIRLLGLPYFVIHNEPGEDGLTQAVSDLARRAGLS